MTTYSLFSCQKCCKEFIENSWVSGETYESIDIHHNPPQFMVKESGKWEGNLINLCRKCHRELHDNILDIMFKFSNLFKFKKSEYWTWLAIIGNERNKCIEEVKNFTEEWLKEKKVGNENP